MNPSNPSSFRSAQASLRGQRPGDSRLKHLRTALLAGAAFIVAGMSPALAQSTSWTGEANDGGNWFTPGNWSNGLPTGSVNYSGNPIVSGDVFVRQPGAVSGGRLWVGAQQGTTNIGDNNNQGTLTIVEGGTLNLLNGLTIGGRQGTGTVTVSGNGSILDVASALYVSRGSLTIESGAKVSAAGEVRVSRNGDQPDLSPYVKVTGNGSVLDVADNLVVYGTAAYGQPDYYSTVVISDGGAVNVAGQVGLGTSCCGNGPAMLIVGAAEGEDATGAGTLAADGGITFGNKAILVLNHTGTDAAAFDLSPVLTGGSYIYDASTLTNRLAPDSGTIINQIAGVTHVTGTSLGFLGVTNVEGGTLLLATSGSALGGTINVSGGILGGIGMIGTPEWEEYVNEDVTRYYAASSATIASGGTLSPGLTGQVGTLTVRGDLAFEAGSTYAVHVAADKTSDMTNVLGKVTIANGAKLKVTALGGQGDYVDYSGAGHTYTIVTAAGGLSGTFTDPGLGLPDLHVILGGQQRICERCAQG
jgi:T5SS/PEP-CTERM-associated repeat protein